MNRFLLMLVVALVAGSARASDVPPKGQSWRNPKDGMTFVRVPAGSFDVQPADGESSQTANPTKSTNTTIRFPKGFWMARTETTVGQFRRFVRQTGYVTDAEKAKSRLVWSSPGFKQTDKHPVVFLSYQDALNYARWADVDLPTEQEWLYACRAGTTSQFYWGDALDDRFVWHRANTGGTGTRPVARKRPNAWGLYDMVGNAWEYCRVDEVCYVFRGSSWTRCPEYRTRQGFMATNLIADGVANKLTRHEHPNPAPPYPWDDDRGFRCVLHGAPR